MRHPIRFLLRAALSAALLLPLTVLLSTDGHAQSYINQTAVADILNRRAETLDDIPEVYYNYRVLYDDRDNSVRARNRLYKILGHGDMALGRKRAQLVELLNRRLMQDLTVGDTIVVPTDFNLDFRAYSPFPRYYTGAREFDKLFIIDKTIQAWAAYEYGKLARWGIVNTGNPDESPTPTGRYNFNWQEEHRVSSLSPPGETWDMYWVFNFHQARGIHIHQYPLPTGGPTSHGCVRLVDADAEWIYHWADTWRTTARGSGIGSGQGRIVEPGTTVLVLGEDPKDDHPHPFDFKKRYPVLKRVDLPEHPYDVPPGTPQQEYFDRLRFAEGTN
ncbi:MAG: L,D-transpeptidase family protein [Bacteroidetes bacterium]|jgi:hypothetical protein|nr:L,D-transpeptidase family protein [Bacteroidota bacterium]